VPGYDPRTLLERRLQPRKTGILDIDSPLEHFALITYSVPPERLAPHIPADRFDIPTFDIEGERRALLSVVPFIDADFRFRLLPFPRFRFGQTNYRVYVTDLRTGEPVVWFFGTTLGGWPVHLARFLWKIPWYPAKYTWSCEYDEANGRYETYRYETRSKWGAARIDVRDTGVPVGTLPGFSSRDEMTLVLTHPVDGYFYRLDGRVGTYSVAHEVLPLTVAEPVDLHFDLLERLGVLDAEAMQRPHSVLLCRRTKFHIYMPPRRVR
jgi:uncharacterized protein YqjF (DUF2071 family)